MWKPGDDEGGTQGREPGARVSNEQSGRPVDPAKRIFLTARSPGVEGVGEDSAASDILAHHSVGLVDAIDHLLNRGACVVGDATISLGGVDMIYLGLSLVVSSVETMRRHGYGGAAPRPPTGGLPSGPNLRALPEEGAKEAELQDPGPNESPRRTWIPEEVDELANGDDTDDVRPGPPSAPPDSREAQNALARLVLTLVELLRQLLERQAIRRMEGTSLSEEEVERMGMALQDLEAKLTELRDLFGLTESDLNIDLGPLGRLL